MGQHLSQDVTLWRQLVEKHKAFALALKEFLSDRSMDRISLLQNALHGEDRATAIYLLPHLSVLELKQLWPELIVLASFSHGAIKTIRDVILALPRDWVLANIEEAVEPLIEQGTYDEYRRFLELYMDLDHELALKLAQRAVEHPDVDIREAGEDILKELQG